MDDGTEEKQFHLLQTTPL